MKAIIAWWKLDDSQQNIESLCNRLMTEGMSAWKKVKGLHLKYWLSNKEHNLWGAIMIWDSVDAMRQSLPPNWAMELIGYPPTLRIIFDIDAMVNGELLNTSFTDLCFGAL